MARTKNATDEFVCIKSEGTLSDTSDETLVTRVARGDSAALEVLAGALTAIGMLFIYAGRLFERFPSQGRVIRFVPVLSALFVSAIGAAIIWKALGEIM